jgi:hypothetical protein
MPAQRDNPGGIGVTPGPQVVEDGAAGAESVGTIRDQFLNAFTPGDVSRDSGVRIEVFVGH